MLTTHHKLVLVLALQLGLAGSTALTTAQAAPTQPPTSESRVSHSTVDKVTLHVTGGFAGVDQWRTVDSHTPNPGRDRLFSLVSSPQLQALATRYVPANECCDRFHYTLKVTGADGNSKSVDTVDGSGAPTVLFDVIDLTRTTGS